MERQMPRLWIVNHHAVVATKDGTTGRHHGLAVELQKLGWDVTLIVASTSHPTGTQQMRGLRTRRVLDEAGVRTVVLRTNAYGASQVLRLIGQLLFAVHLLAPWSTRGIPRPDLIIGSTVHPFAASAAGVLARRYRVPFAYEVRDVWPETLIDMGALRADGVIARVLRRLSRHSAARAKLVISPLRNLRSYLREIDLPDKPFVWIPNGVPKGFGEIEGAQPPLKGQGFAFMYLGTHGTVNSLDLIISSFARAVELTPEVDLRLRFVGEGPKKRQLQALAQQSPARSRISFEAAIPRDEVHARAQEADCLIMALPQLPVFRYGISPNKLFDYLMAARPIIFSGDGENPVSDCGAGAATPAGDAESLARAMRMISLLPGEDRAEMGRRGREHVAERYTYEVLGVHLDRALRGVLAADRAPGATTGSSARDSGEPRC